MVTILFPGRHHLLSKFQYNYLRDLIDKGINGKKVDKIIFAVTSADHSNTRRNPIPLYLRAIAIEKFSRDLLCEIKIYPIPDVKETKDFANYILRQIYYQGNDKLNPKNCVIGSSTPSVIELFNKLKFDVMSFELFDSKKEKYSSIRPYEIINLLVKAGKNWRVDKVWKEYVSQASLDLYLEYNLGDLIVELFQDSLLNEDADLTDTRDYNVYARGMDQNVMFKFKDIEPFVVQGKIVDAGCGTGALVYQLSKEFAESDIIGVEATRKFYEFCRLQEYPNPFVFFYRRNILNQNFKENTINTFIYSSVLHEIYSYIDKSSLIKLLKGTNYQLANKGRIIIRDVVGPDDPNKEVYMDLNKNDGKDTGDIHVLSTSAKFLMFVKDFKPRKIKYSKVEIDGKELIKIKLVDAYEFISKMNYVDNWLSEMHEEFGFWSFSVWKKELEKAGFRIVEGSKTFKSQYIIDKMYKGKVVLYKKINGKLVIEDYPPTNMIISGEK